MMIKPQDCPCVLRLVSTIPTKTKYHPLREDSDAKSSFFLPQACRHAGMPGRHTIDRHHSTHYTLPFKLSKVTHCCSHLCDLSPERPLVDEGISLLTLCSAPLLSRAHLSLVSERSDPKLWVRVSYRFEFECVFVAVVFFAPSVEHYCATCANGGYLELNCIWERNLTMSMTYFEHF